MNYMIKFTGDTKFAELFQRTFQIKDESHWMESEDCFPVPPRKGDLVDLFCGCGGELETDLWNTFEEISNWSADELHEHILDCFDESDPKIELLKKLFQEAFKDNEWHNWIQGTVFEVTNVLHVLSKDACLFVTLKATENNLSDLI